MKNFIGKFSLREALQIVLPGIYLSGLLIPLLNEVVSDNINYTRYGSVDIILFSIFTLMNGMIIYSIDMPKRICFFKNNLPTERLKKEYPNDTKIENKYFKFYDEKISDKQKNITEKYTSIYHFAINITISSFLILIVYLVCFQCKVIENAYVILVFFISLLSLVLSLTIFYGHKKIKHMFDRQYLAFKNDNNNLNEN